MSMKQGSRPTWSRSLHSGVHGVISNVTGSITGLLNVEFSIFFVFLISIIQALVTLISVCDVVKYQKGNRSLAFLSRF